VTQPPESVTPLVAPLVALLQLLSEFEGRGVIIGGIAASLLGKPRLTADLDAMILLSIEEVSRLIEIAQMEGLEPRVKDVQEFALRHRVVLLRHTASGTNVDISLGILPFEEQVVERRIEYQVGSLLIPLPTPEDLIIMKAVAHRPNDLADIQAIIENHPDLDQERIEDWVHQFAEALEMPELWEDIDKMFRRR
jgi:hypothetical protein